MAKFFVGQRVRVVGQMENGAPGVHGQEARIVGATGPYTGISGKTYPYRVEMATGAWAGRTVLGNSSDFQPILPERHQPSEFTTLADLLASLEVTA